MKTADEFNLTRTERDLAEFGVANEVHEVESRAQDQASRRYDLAAIALCLIALIAASV